MLFKKENRLALLKIVLILIGIGFFFLLISLPKFIETIPDEGIKFFAKLFVILLVLALAIYATYDDFKYELFTTKKLIITADIIELLSLTTMSFFVLQNNDIIDFDKMIRQSKITIYASTFLAFAILLKWYLKSNRFAKETNKSKP